MGERIDQPVVFHQVDELHRREQAEFGMHPSHQRLGTDGLAARETHLRLVVRDELASVDREADLVDHVAVGLLRSAESHHVGEHRDAAVEPADQRLDRVAVERGVQDAEQRRLVRTRHPGGRRQHGIVVGRIEDQSADAELRRVADELEPVHPAHLETADDEVEDLPAAEQQVEPLLAVVDLVDLAKADLREESDQRCAPTLMFLEDENLTRAVLVH